MGFSYFHNLQYMHSMDAVLDSKTIGATLEFWEKNYVTSNNMESLMLRSQSDLLIFRPIHELLIDDHQVDYYPYMYISPNYEVYKIMRE